MAYLIFFWLSWNDRTIWSNNVFDCEIRWKMFEWQCSVMRFAIESEGHFHFQSFWWQHFWLLNFITILYYYRSTVFWCTLIATFETISILVVSWTPVKWTFHRFYRIENVPSILSRWNFNGALFLTTHLFAHNSNGLGMPQIPITWISLSSCGLLLRCSPYWNALLSRTMTDHKLNHFDACEHQHSLTHPAKLANYHLVFNSERC